MKVLQSLFKKVSYNQKVILEALAEKPEGILSRALTHKTGISNKSGIVSRKLKALLAKESLEIHTERISNQWLWSLRKIQ